MPEIENGSGHKAMDQSAVGEGCEWEREEWNILERNQKRGKEEVHSVAVTCTRYNTLF